MKIKIRNILGQLAYELANGTEFEPSIGDELTVKWPNGERDTVTVAYRPQGTTSRIGFYQDHKGHKMFFDITAVDLVMRP